MRQYYSTTNRALNVGHESLVLHYNGRLKLNFCNDYFTTDALLSSSIMLRDLG